MSKYKKVIMEAAETSLIIRQLGLLDYQQAWQAMCRHVTDRGANTADEIWCLQHPPVYTLGLGGKLSHVFEVGDVPVVRSDRGGQVTYHGPGQLVVYLMLDLHRLGLKVKSYVACLEQSVIGFLAANNIVAMRKENAPGVYVNGGKIAALGIRVKRGVTYHGLSLNVDIDLAPYLSINPCGYQDQEVISLSTLGLGLTVEQSFQLLYPFLLRYLNYPTEMVVPQFKNRLK